VAVHALAAALHPTAIVPAATPQEAIEGPSLAKREAGAAQGAPLVAVLIMAMRPSAALRRAEQLTRIIFQEMRIAPLQATASPRTLQVILPQGETRVSQETSLRVFHLQRKAR
jgi:hypothetical protein